MKEDIVLDSTWYIFDYIFDIMIVLMLIVEASLMFFRTSPFGELTIVYVFLSIFATITNAYVRGPNIWRFLSIFVAIGIGVFIFSIPFFIVWPD